MAMTSTKIGGAAVVALHPSTMVGCTYRCDDRYVVGREEIRQFARAVQDSHPVHRSESAGVEFGYGGLIAPLTFFAIPAFRAQRAMFDTVAGGYDLSRIMQTDQVVNYHKPIRPGDALTCDVGFESFRGAFGSELFEFKTEITDQHDCPLITSRTSFVGRAEGGATRSHSADHLVMRGFHDWPSGAGLRPRARNGSDPRPRSEPGAHGGHTRRFESVTEGEQLPPRVFSLTLGDLVNYAGVAGDPNPIHWHPQAAQAVNLDAPVAHGMLTVGLGAGYLTSWLGDPGAVLEYAVRFTSPVYVTSAGASVEFSGTVRSVDPQQRTAVVAIVATCRGRKIFGRATAKVRLSPT
ncbi:fused (3R)-hydroxyacyl-ACP dehydratase subunits HadA/HadB [Nocardia sp. GTS18]|uniref:fused (3R)-hydroxyacyl-ACP dehydratase subunits HadA/HadB n=1 Tax=unclassified Nocardia TaxID=2637762 RepID=UPI002104B1BD|nr:fused (3R)-hydroxyacyl-ACP dehydratase subunits HadA/HadB [Nocardia sp. GTS18]